ncbi:MAG TPA: helix-turn-helix transcriptional regulator [Solirubrobacterales bacterium]
MRAAGLQIVDVRAALAFVADLLDCSDADQLTVQIDALEDLIGADRALVSGRSPGAPDLSFEVGDRAVYTRELMGAASRNWQEHPVMSADVLAGGEGARRVSDFVPRREWTRRELFNDFYRPLGMSYEVSAQLAWDPLGASCCVALHRSGRDFGARELALLEVLAPHLRLARARIARAASGEAGDLAARLPITPREAEVLALLAAGLTNDGIAADLGISRNTVARHVEHVYGKLGVHTRVAAARAALAALRQ